MQWWENERDLQLFFMNIYYDLKHYISVMITNILLNNLFDYF